MQGAVKKYRRTLAILWAGAPEDEPLLRGRLAARLAESGMGWPRHLLFRPSDAVAADHLRRVAPARIIVAWSGDAPDWSRWFSGPSRREGVRLLHLWDLTTGPTAEPPASKTDPLSRLLHDDAFRRFLHGKLPGRRIPYGLALGPGAQCEDAAGPLLVPGDPQQAEMVRLIFHLYGGGAEHRQGIANLLSAQGIPPPAGWKQWHQHTVDLILGNPAYAGMLSCRGYLRPGAFPPLIPQALFGAVQDRIAAERTVRLHARPSDAAAVSPLADEDLHA